MTASRTSPGSAGRRLDQWLWFARFAKSRSRAARLCVAGAVTVNGRQTRKANQIVRVGDVISVPQGPFRRTVQVVAFGARRGPAVEARLLYVEAAAPVPLTTKPAWVPLLAEEEALGGATQCDSPTAT